MARVTSAEVQEILLNDYDGSSDLSAFITAANLLTDRVSTCATSRGRSLSTNELKEIERWLSAHFYAMSDQPYKEKETGKSKGVFQGVTEDFLKASKYGQTAVTLDYSGCLSGIGGNKKARAAWLGKPVSEQTDYVDRD